MTGTPHPRGLPTPSRTRSPGWWARAERSGVRRTRSALDEQTGDLTIRRREAAAFDHSSGVDVKKREISLDRPRVMYRVEEAAELLSLSRDRVYQLIRSNQLRSVRIGRARRVPARRK